MELRGCSYEGKQPAALTIAFTKRQKAWLLRRGELSWAAGHAGRYNSIMS